MPSQRRHLAVSGAFVRTKLVVEETARALPRVFEKRRSSDYGDYAEATQDQVVSLRVRSESFSRPARSFFAETRLGDIDGQAHTAADLLLGACTLEPRRIGLCSSFLVWIGQAAVVAGLPAFMLRGVTSK